MSRSRDLANLGDGIDTSSITSGTFADARIASSNVTQHEGSIDALASNPTVTLGSNTTFGSGVSLTNATFPSGHCIQIVNPSPSIEENALTTTFQNLFEVNITLKGGSSKILIFYEFQFQAQSGSGLGSEVLRHTSSPVTTSHTTVFNLSNADTTGPLNYYWTSSEAYFTASHFYVDDVSSLNAGDTVYYGFFHKERNGTITLPPNNTTDGYLKTTLLEISG